MELFRKYLNELSYNEHFFYVMTRKAHLLSCNLASLEEIEEYLGYFGEDEFNYFYELQDARQSFTPMWDLYNKLQVSYAVLEALLNARGHKTYQEEWFEGVSFNDVLAGKKVVFYKKEGEKVLKTVLSVGASEKGIIGFRVKAKVFTLDPEKNEEEQLREIMKEEQEELEEEKVERIYDALLRAKGKVEEKEEEGFEEIKTVKVKVINDLCLTLASLEEETGLSKEEILKGLGRLIKEGRVVPYYGYLEVALEKCQKS